MNARDVWDGFGSSSLPIILVDLAGKVSFSNTAACRLLGREAAGLADLHISEFLSVEAVSDLAAIIASASSGFAVIRLTGRDPTGRPVPISAQVTTWTDDTREPQYGLILTDIESELEVERQVRQDLTLSNNAIRGAHIGVFEYDPIRDTVVVSAIWRELLELDPAETLDLQLEWRSRVHPEDLATALEPIRLCVEEKQLKAGCEYRLRSRDGSLWRWMRTDVVIAEKDDVGRVTIVNGAMSDVTERKEMGAELRKSIEQFRSAFEAAPIGKAIVGLDGSFLRVNAALCNFLGYSEGELRQLSFQTVTHPDDLDQDLFQLDRLKRGEIPAYRQEKRYIRKDGAIIWGLLSVGMVSDSEGQPDQFIAQIVDITEDRHLRDLKSEFVSIVSHELRTPLTAVLGSLSLLSSMEDEPFSDAAQRLLYIADQNGQRLLHLVNDILDFDNLSHHKMGYSQSRQYIARLLDEALLTNLAAADLYRVRFDLFCPDRSLTAFVDPGRFHQIMGNLLSNATKFADEGSTIEIIAERQAATIRVSVSNHGAGIPEDFRDQLFKPFSQIPAATTRKRGGTGLGLSITKEIVAQMGGTIGFESPVDGITTFWFTVPAEDTRRKPSSIAQDASPNGERGGL